MTKFFIEQIFRVDSSTIGVFFLADDNGSILGELSASFTAGNYSTESDFMTAVRSAVVSWANGDGGYSGVTSEDVYCLKPNLATVATTGDYTDLSNKPTIPSTTRTTSSLSLSLVGTGATGTQIDASKDSSVKVNVSTSTTATIGGAATSLVSLKICATNDSTEGNWTTVATFENDQTITLALALQSVQVMKGQLTADVPAGWYVKLVNSGSGTHSESFISGQKTIYG